MNDEGNAVCKHIPHLFRLVVRSGDVVALHIENALRSVGVSKAKMEALQQLVHAGEPLPLGQLADRLHCGKSNMTTLVDRLEADGLVQRLHEPGDRRTVFAQITPAGHASYMAGMQKLEEIEQELLALYTPVERAQLNQLLERLSSLEG